MEFEHAARDWNELLLQDATCAAFAQQHVDTVLQLAATLACAQDEKSAVDYAGINKICASKDDEQALLSLAFAVKRLLRVAVRERIRFLVSSEHPAASSSPSDTDASASQRDTLAHQHALMQQIPSAFRHGFVQTLRDHWELLEQTAAATAFSLPRLADMRWSVAVPGVVALRLVTTDGVSRTLQMPLQQFHALRFSAAKVLQEMHSVEAHPILRLARSEQQRHSAGPATTTIAP